MSMVASLHQYIFSEPWYKSWNLKPSNYSWCWNARWHVLNPWLVLKFKMKQNSLQHKEVKTDCTSKAPWYCHRRLKKLIQALKRRNDLFQGCLGTSRREQDAWHKQGALSPVAAGSAWGPWPVLEGPHKQPGETGGWQGCPVQAASTHRDVLPAPGWSGSFQSGLVPWQSWGQVCQADLEVFCKQEMHFII